MKTTEFFQKDTKIKDNDRIIASLAKEVRQIHNNAEFTYFAIA